MSYSTPAPAVIPPLIPVTPPSDPQTLDPTAPSTSALEAQLIEAKAQIVSLTTQLDQALRTGLRKRNTTQDDSANPPTAQNLMQTTTEQGVPVKIVAYLCLAAFLLAYLFF
jgi:hypothetical protein